MHGVALFRHLAAGSDRGGIAEGICAHKNDDVLVTKHVAGRFHKYQTCSCLRQAALEATLQADQHLISECLTKLQKTKETWYGKKKQAHKAKFLTVGTGTSCIARGCVSPVHSCRITRKCGHELEDVQGSGVSVGRGVLDRDMNGMIGHRRRSQHPSRRIVDVCLFSSFFISYCCLLHRFSQDSS